MRNAFQESRRRARFALAALAACLCLSAAAGPALAQSASPAASASPGAATFHYGTQEYIDSLNPFIGYSGVDYLVYHLNYQFLVGFDPQQLQPRPEFAESWSHSPDGLTWTFKIRPGMKWQDGLPATAHDAAFTFNYILDNNLAAFTGYLTLVESVTAPDDTTLVITTSKPKADILTMKVPILPEHIWSKVSGKAAETTFTNGPPVIGSGPYQVVQNKHNEYCRLVANPGYWGGKPALDEVLFESYQNPDTMVQDLKTGALDAVMGVPRAQFKVLNDPGLTTNACVSYSFEQITFNCYDDPHSKGNPVLLDPAFRQAIQYAVDRETNASVAYGGYMSPSGTLLPPYSAFNWQPSASEAYTYDPAKAQAMLDAAGYKDVNGDGFRETRQGKPLSLRLYTDAQTPENVTTSKLVVGWLKKVGIKLKFQAMDPGALADVEANTVNGELAPDFDLVIWWWQGDAEDPQFILSLLTPGQIGGWSDTFWTDTQYTKLFQEQSMAIDSQTRIGLVQQMQQIAYTSSPYVIFGYFQFLQAYDTAHWQGYVKVPGGFPGYNGNALAYETFLKVHPATAAPAAAAGGTPAWVYAVAGAAVALVVVVIWLLLRRRRAEVEPEE